LTQRVKQLEQMLRAVPLTADECAPPKARDPFLQILTVLQSQSFGLDTDPFFTPYPRPWHGSLSSNSSSQVSAGDMATLHKTLSIDSQEDVGLPPLLHIRIAVDDFFEHSHNQPYSFFHEETFRSRLEQNLVPEHLLLAVLAAAARFAKGEANRISAGRVWADRSWDLVLKRLDSDEEIDVSVVQAAALSAIYDFAARTEALGGKLASRQDSHKTWR
ncbi:hypothetical protein DH86_00002117, partial [Scytalidium sp. 3C]